MNVKIDSQHSSGKYDETICCEEEEEFIVFLGVNGSACAGGEFSSYDFRFIYKS
jgi:hypothetical protein